jgi:RNA polymerase sigma-70 factor, ECF subfamily
MRNCVTGTVNAPAPASPHDRLPTTPVPATIQERVDRVKFRSGGDISFGAPSVGMYVETSERECAAEYDKIPGLPLESPTADATRADVALLDRIVQRDPNALGELYDKHSRLLFGLLLRILNNHEEAEEVLQEVFVQVWTRAGTYHGALGSPAGWLIGIARNRAIDRLRAQARRRGTPDAATSPAADTPEGLASRGEQQLDIQRALDVLPPEQRSLIEAAYFLGFTHAELAERYRLPLGTVKTRIRSGMQTLRKHLERRYIEQ